MLNRASHVRVVLALVLVLVLVVVFKNRSSSRQYFLACLSVLWVFSLSRSLSPALSVSIFLSCINSSLQYEVASIEFNFSRRKPGKPHFHFHFHLHWLPASRESPAVACSVRFSNSRVACRQPSLQEKNRSTAYSQVDFAFTRESRCAPSPAEPREARLEKGLRFPGAHQGREA